MKTILLLLTTLAACGIDTHTNTEVVKEVPKEVPVPAEDLAGALAGFYELPNGGYIELTALNDGRVRIETQYILTVNKDKKLAYHPAISAGPHVVKASGSLIYAQNLTYSSTTHDVEKDGSTSNISGVKRTELVISKNEIDNLLVTLVIKDGTSVVSPILVNRTLESK